jgi:hypothetical protein
LEASLRLKEEEILEHLDQIRDEHEATNDMSRKFDKLHEE